MMQLKQAAALAVQIRAGGPGAPFAVWQLEQSGTPGGGAASAQDYVPTGGVIWVECGGMNCDERLLIAIKQCLLQRFTSAHTI